MPIVTLIDHGGYWSVYVDGVRTVDRESFAIADRVATMVRTGQTDHTECGDVARRILDWRATWQSEGGHL